MGANTADGTPFGRYRLIELLGRGGMGEVWQAHDTETDRIVAIKVLPANLSEDEDFKRRFRREAHAAARLNDPHVIPIHHYGEIDGRLYLDMRLIKGRDLAAVLADGPLDPSRAVRIIGQVAEALHAAHEEGLLHRDIKPSNILLGKNDFAYLIDFGIARTMGETRMTQTGSAIGTFQYIAPERLAIGADEDARADIYSLAYVLYECLTGGPPFPGDTMPQLVAAHLSAPPPRPSITRPEVPAQVDEVIATGMAKDPNQRYATTVELADAAREAINVPIPRPTPSTAPHQPRARRPLRGREAIGMRVGKIINHYKMAKHFSVEITDEAFTFARKTNQINAEAALDGIYVLRTSLPEQTLTRDDAVLRYKGLEDVERFFRTLNSELDVRPIRHHLANRVRAHVFLRMLSYYISWHMKQALAPILFHDHDKHAAAAKRTDPVAAAQRSDAALTKAARKRTDDDHPVHSFTSLLADLATIGINHIQPVDDMPAFTMLTTPTPLQRRAFELLDVSHRLGYM